MESSATTSWTLAIFWTFIGTKLKRVVSAMLVNVTLLTIAVWSQTRPLSQRVKFAEAADLQAVVSAAICLKLETIVAAVLVLASKFRENVASAS